MKIEDNMKISKKKAKEQADRNAVEDRQR